MSFRRLVLPSALLFASSLRPRGEEIEQRREHYGDVPAADEAPEQTEEEARPCIQVKPGDNEE
jgi:hypothetical protein